MTDYKGMIVAATDRALALREATSADPLLSDEGKRAQVARLVVPLETDAAETAAVWLRSLERAGARAEQAHVEARKRAAANVDISRRTYIRGGALEQAEYGSWSDIRAELDDSLELDDPDRLAVWAELLPRVGARYDGAGGPASDPSTGYAAYYGRVKAALQAHVPEDVGKSRAELTTAADALSEARGFLENTDLARSYRGAPPVFGSVLRPPAVVVSEYDERSGTGMVTSTGGHSAFG